MELLGCEGAIIKKKKGGILKAQRTVVMHKCRTPVRCGFDTRFKRFCGLFGLFQPVLVYFEPFLGLFGQFSAQFEQD